MPRDPGRIRMPRWVESERAELVRLRAESRDDKSAIAELRMQVEVAET